MVCRWCHASRSRGRRMPFKRAVSSWMMPATSGSGQAHRFIPSTLSQTAPPSTPGHHQRFIRRSFRAQLRTGYSAGHRRQRHHLRLAAERVRERRLWQATAARHTYGGRSSAARPDTASSARPPPPAAPTAIGPSAARPVTASTACHRHHRPPTACSAEQQHLRARRLRQARRTGITYGGRFESDSTVRSRRLLRADASAATGTTYGVIGFQSNSTSGRGVYG